MIIVRLCLLFVFCTFFSTTVFSQKIIAFDKHGKVKRVKYFQGEYIKIKKKSGEKIEGTITGIKSASFFVGGREVYLDSVKKVINTQKYYGFRVLYGFSIRAGLIYLPLSSFNRQINQDDPVVTKSAVLVSTTFLGVAAISSLIYNRGYKISNKRPLKIIDISP